MAEPLVPFPPQDDEWPAFPPTISTRTADALVRLFTDDPALYDAMGGRIYGAELEELFLRQETIVVPSLLVLLDGLEQRRSGSNHQARRRTFIRYGLLRGPAETRRAGGWSTSRCLEYTIALIYRQGAQLGGAGGVLLDPEGRPLTMGLEVVTRVPRPVLLPGLENFLLTRVDAVFNQVVDERTGGPIDEL